MVKNAELKLNKDTNTATELDIQNSSYIQTGFVMANNKLIRALLNEQITGVSNSSCLAVYLIILSHRNTKTNRCFPSIELIAKETGMSRSSVLRIVGVLEEKGYLSIEKKTGESNMYFFPYENFKSNEKELEGFNGENSSENGNEKKGKSKGKSKGKGKDTEKPVTEKPVTDNPVNEKPTEENLTKENFTKEKSTKEVEDVFW